MRPAEPYGWTRLGSLEDAVMKVIGDHYGLPARGLSIDTELSADLGADYIDAREVLMTLEELFEVYFEPEAAVQVPRTVGDVIKLVRAACARQANLEEASS